MGVGRHDDRRSVTVHGRCCGTMVDAVLVVIGGG